MIHRCNLSDSVAFLLLHLEQARQFPTATAGLHSVQEIDNADEGRMPRTIEIEITHDLVGSCRAGDVVTVLGLVKVMNAEAEGGMHLMLYSTVLPTGNRCMLWQHTSRSNRTS